MKENIYLTLTREFNVGRRRAILSSGQAVVLHRLAVMSKDGDWIIRDDEESLRHLLRQAHTIVCERARDVLPGEVRSP